MRPAAEAIESGSQASFAFLIIANRRTFTIESKTYGKRKRRLFRVCDILTI